MTKHKLATFTAIIALGIIIHNLTPDKRIFGECSEKCNYIIDCTKTTTEQNTYCYYFPNSDFGDILLTIPGDGSTTARLVPDGGQILRWKADTCSFDCPRPADRTNWMSKGTNGCYPPYTPNFMVNTKYCEEPDP